MKKTPLQIVKEKFGSKEELVGKVSEMLKAVGETKDELKERLQHTTNKKLLRLHEITEKVKEEYGSKEKMVEKILELRDRTRDLPYKEKLMKYSVPRLFDMVKTEIRKARSAKAE